MLFEFPSITHVKQNCILIRQFIPSMHAHAHRSCHTYQQRHMKEVQLCDAYYKNHFCFITLGTSTLVRLLGTGSCLWYCINIFRDWWWLLKVQDFFWFAAKLLFTTCPRRSLFLKKYFANEFCNRERCGIMGMKVHVETPSSHFVFFDVTFLITRERGTSAASLPLSLVPAQRGITKPLTTQSPFYFLSFINTTILSWELGPSLIKSIQSGWNNWWKHDKYFQLKLVRLWMSCL